MALVQGKKALILGVANDHSIAWSVAQALHREGARLAFTYVGDNLERRVRPLAESVAADLVLPCDVSDDRQIESLFAALAERWGSLDIIVHSVAFAPREDLKGRLLDTSRAGFHVALDVSAYSLIAVARAAEPLLSDDGCLLTMTYFGAEKVMPGYNVMGMAKAALEAAVRYLSVDLGARAIRINAISAGPLRTLSSAGVSGFRDMLHHHAERSPMRRNITASEVADTALFLCSSLAGGITGEVIHVDAGYNVMGI